MGFPTPLVEVATRIHGRNVKALIDYGSTGNYISHSLVPALGMEVILEKDFEVLQLANKTTIKAHRATYPFGWTSRNSVAESLPGCFPT